jgi:hemerythrin
MDYDRMLAELFSEEDRARDMATRLAELARKSRETAAGEKGSLVAFLRGPMERHFVFEETLIFPKLEEHGLGPEVQVASKQHDALRQLAATLETSKPEDDIAQLIFEVARLMLHHTNFEGDYIYPELTHEEWRRLMMETAAAGATQPTAQPSASPRADLDRTKGPDVP